MKIEVNLKMEKVEFNDRIRSLARTDGRTHTEKKQRRRKKSWTSIFEIDECALCVCCIQTRSMACVCFCISSCVLKRSHAHTEWNTHSTNNTDDDDAKWIRQARGIKNEINVRCVDEKSCASNGHYSNSSSCSWGKTFQIISQDVK